MSEVPVLFTVPQVCRMLQISRSKAYELVSTGEIPSIQIGRSRRIPAAQFRAYIDSLVS